MEVLWCRICETNRKPSYMDEIYLVCNVCGLVLRTDDLADPESPPEHPVHTCAQNLGISDECAIGDALVCYEKASGHFQCCEIVAAICLYIGCRANEIPIMLFDLSMAMRVSVYYVGLMFLDVCKFLTCKIDGFRPPDIVDPVFFIHRFTNNFNVLLTALRILAAIKSNYVGRRNRLGGLCAAAVYMAANFNGLDVDTVVPNFQAILSKTLVRCRILEFARVAQEYKFLNGQEYIMGNVDVLCPHNVEKFCHGFCHVCYNKFVKLSGYFSGGSDEAPTRRGIAVRTEDDVQVLCGKKRLSSIINFDALRQVFGDDDVAQSTNTKSKESNGSSNAMEQGQAREEIWGDELANGGDAQGREDLANKDDQREEVLANKARRRFQPKRLWVRRLGLQR